MRSRHDSRTVVLSLGGSVIVPDELDQEFLSDFAAFIRRQLAAHLERRFVIITGGGRTARRYQRAARACAPTLSTEDLDWIGIRATRLNAQLLRVLLPEAHPTLIENPEGELPAARVLVGAGWKPGFSTDYDAAVIAGRLGALLVNVSNISHVYSADPNTDPAAKPLQHLSWEELLAITGEEWRPGLHAPFDPVAAKHCRDARLTAAIVAADLANLAALLDGEDFVGTLIEPTRSI